MTRIIYEDNESRLSVLEVLYQLQQHLLMNEDNNQDRELIMRLAPLYEQNQQRVKQEARQEAEQNIIIRLLNRRLGNIDESLIAKIKELPSERLDLLVEDLLDFSNIADLETWLNQ